ncbi:hypothetical protein QUF56_18115 [Ureibacillus composti]|nr:hypothetical protein [Ureibacillus composti]HWJ79127.1 hypothetical protein [Niallia sp.]
MTRFQAHSIGLSGVSWWHDVLDLIRKIHKKYEIEEGNIIADYKEKEQVFQHMSQTYQFLEEALNQINYSIYFATWDINEGKGIEDFVINGGFPLFVGVKDIRVVSDKKGVYKTKEFYIVYKKDVY